MITVSLWLYPYQINSGTQTISDEDIFKFYSIPSGQVISSTMTGWSAQDAYNAAAQFALQIPNTSPDLTPNDITELKMEFVDMFHFFMNFGIVIGMTPKELYNMYFAKAGVNVQRQKGGCYWWWRFSHGGGKFSY